MENNKVSKDFNPISLTRFYLLIPIFLFFLITSKDAYAISKGSTAEVMINPAVIETKTIRGSVKIFTIEITNRSEEQVQKFHLYTTDLTMTKTGGPEFPEAGTTKYSCAKWIKCDPEFITIEPGRSKKVVFKLIVPVSAIAGGYYAAIVFELKPEKEKLNKILNIQWRIASLFKLTITSGALIKKAFIEDLVIKELDKNELNSSDTVDFMATVKNEGNVHIVGDGILVIRNKDGRIIGQTHFFSGKGTILPESVRVFKAEYKNFLPRGEYIAEAIIKYGGSQPAIRKIPFSVTSLRNSNGTDNDNFYVKTPDLKLSPTNLELKIPGGGFKTSAIKVTNQTESIIHIKTYLSEVEQELMEEQGSIKEPNQIKAYIKPIPSEFSIEPNKTKTIVLNIQIPKELKGKFNAKLIFEPEQKKDEEQNLATAELKLEII